MPNKKVLGLPKRNDHPMTTPNSNPQSKPSSNSSKSEGEGTSTTLTSQPQSSESPHNSSNPNLSRSDQSVGSSPLSPDKLAKLRGIMENTAKSALSEILTLGEAAVTVPGLYDSLPFQARAMLMIVKTNETAEGAVKRLTDAGMNLFENFTAHAAKNKLTTGEGLLAVKMFYAMMEMFADSADNPGGPSEAPKKEDLN